MFQKIISFGAFISSAIAGNSGSLLVGGARDSNNCLISAGYTWCESSQQCIRQWETPCSDNFQDCPDCFERQSNGENIACPEYCDMLAVDPMPPPMPPPMPVPVVDPVPVPVVDPMPPVNNPFLNHACPEVMCMMYCQYGNVRDSNGCQLCQCNDNIPPPITDIDCTLTQPSCDDYTYICPKITEITNCNQGGIDGYTTFQLSLTIKDTETVKNIYALYGDLSDPMYLPPAYQTLDRLKNNIGGVNPFMLEFNPDSRYDSWLTIGVTDGNQDNLISSIGIDFDSWNSNRGINVNDGAVFVLDPDSIVVSDNEYIIGQITVRTGTSFTAIFNVQGKSNVDTIKSWNEENIRFDLNTPTENVHDTVPNNCLSWYDGCNTCTVNNGVLGGCTRMMCFREDNPRCLEYNSVGH